MRNIGFKKLPNKSRPYVPVQLEPTITTFGNISGNSKYNRGVLANNGKIYCAPFNATQVLEITLN